MRFLGHRLYIPAVFFVVICAVSIKVSGSESGTDSGTLGNRDDSSAAVFAAISEPKISGSFEYTELEDGICITKYIGEKATAVVPTAIAGLPVRRIGASAFAGCSAVNIEMPLESITVVEERAFSQCTKLRQVRLATTITSIGDYAFEGCSSLEAVFIPGSVQNLGEGAFSGCSSLMHAEFERLSALDRIRREAFAGCLNLKVFIVTRKVAAIDDRAFAGCSNLRKVVFACDAPQMGEDVFLGCSPQLTAYCATGRTGYSNPWYGLRAINGIPEEIDYFSIYGFERPTDENGQFTSYGIAGNGGGSDILKAFLFAVLVLVLGFIVLLALPMKLYGRLAPVHRCVILSRASWILFVIAVLTRYALPMAFGLKLLEIRGLILITLLFFIAAAISAIGFVLGGSAIARHQEKARSLGWYLILDFVLILLVYLLQIRGT